LASSFVSGSSCLRAAHIECAAVANIVAGTNTEFPIPGLSVEIPVVGSAGVFAAVKLEGDANQLSVQLGLDACGQIFGETECGSKLTSELPVWVFQVRVPVVVACCSWFACVRACMRALRASDLCFNTDSLTLPR
jgi:hypothetical protein